MKRTEVTLFSLFRSYSWLLIGVWTGCIAGSLLWNLREQGRHSIEMARGSARISFENDVLYRRWSARQGGVYVPISQDTSPNPHLDVPNRDVTTTSGLSLTLVNPAYMVRQVNEMADAAGGSRGHITSLNPIRPENAPDAWEAAALRSFERGLAEAGSTEKIGRSEYLRLMRPLVVERSCLKCHAAQGYKEGDIRGGISISVPLAPLRAIERPMTAHLVLAHLGLWTVGLAGIAISKRGLGREILAREQAEGKLRQSAGELERRVAEQTAEIRRANETLEQRIAERTADLQTATAFLRESEERYRTLFETAPDAIIVHRDGRFLYANSAALLLTGAETFQQLARHRVLDFFRPQDREQAVERTRTVMAGNRLPIWEATLLRLDGHEIEVEFHTAPMDFQGARTVLTIIRDVTARKQAEESLRELNATLESKVAVRTAELQERTKQLQKLALQLSQAEDQERRRIAVFLHEDLQQQIAGAKFQLSLLNGRTRRDPKQQAVIADIDETLRGAIEKSRSLSHELSPAVLHQNDLGEAFRWLAIQMRARHGLLVHVDALGDVSLHSDALAVFLFRAAQEVLLNVAKHAGVKDAAVRVGRRGRYVRLSVSDRGRGFDPKGLRESTGLGLLSLRERSELLGGRMKIRSTAGQGSTFHIVVPDV